MTRHTINVPDITACWHQSNHSMIRIVLHIITGVTVKLFSTYIQVHAEGGSQESIILNLFGPKTTLYLVVLPRVYHSWWRSFGHFWQNHVVFRKTTRSISCFYIRHGEMTRRRGLDTSWSKSCTWPRSVPNHGVLKEDWPRLPGLRVHFIRHIFSHTDQIQTSPRTIY